MGTPVINLLQIKDLALEYGMDLSPGKRYAPSKKLYHMQSTTPFSKMVLVIALTGAVFLLMPLRKRKQGEDAIEN
jgi:hypothetical protein